jgi:hypothetical protein
VTCSEARRRCDLPACVTDEPPQPEPFLVVKRAALPPLFLPLFVLM